jgi:isopenicillin-N epimerase
MPATQPPDPADWPSLRSEWTLADDVIYLNHGSFGPSPLVVQQARLEWTALLERNPMDFFVRRMETELEAAAARLGAFVGADGDDLILVENATAGMNIVAANVRLGPGDEVLVSDQEYGAVLRIWRQMCQRSGANLVTARLPARPTSQSEVVDAFWQSVTDKTRLIVVSHITSPTAVIFPVEEICRRARERDIWVCVDGPHALAMLPLNLRRIDCDFYTASCHKWLSAPFGSGLLYVRRRHQQGLQPAVVSWGGSLSGRPVSWKDEFNWTGTRDPAAFLAISAALDFLDDYGPDQFRENTHALARYARQRIVAQTGLEPPIPDSPAWYGSMIALPLPPPRPDEAKPKHSRRDPLQDKLWEQFRIEIPITESRGQRYLRVSCHLYNDRSEIDRLVDAVCQLLDSGGRR